MSTTAQFSVEYTQFLDENGKPTQTLPKDATNKKLMTNLYELMVLLRLCDTKTINLQRTGKIGTYPSVLGQEAISVAIGNVMEKDDVLAPYYRDHGAQMQRGFPLEKILQYWGGDERGSDFDNPHDLPIAVPIASQCILATGIAKAIQYRKEPRVVVTTIGEGGTSKGDFYEAINLAGAWNLPMVFVVNNNQWAISVPREQQTICQTFAQKAFAGGMSGEQVDGNDIIAVRESLKKALEKARLGKGPTLIEAISYRLSDHTTADDASRYRSKKELEEAWEREPIKRLKQFMMDNNLWSEAEEQKLQESCKKRVDDIVQKYLNEPPQKLTDIVDYLYATLPKFLQEQRDTLIAFGDK